MGRARLAVNPGMFTQKESTMSLSINTNAVSLNAQRNTINTMQSLQTTMSHLS